MDDREGRNAELADLTFVDPNSNKVDSRKLAPAPGERW